MIYWAQLFHFYQPPTQLPPVLDKICNESYRPLLEVFRQYPGARVTVNINGVLTEMLRDCGHQDVIDGLIGIRDFRVYFLDTFPHDLSAHTKQ